MKFFYHSSTEAGTDEAGRGCLAGPVTAAAVILPADFYDNTLTDSKQLSQKQRERLRLFIEKEAIAYAVAHVSAQEIDAINILKASILAMHKAIEMLKRKPTFIAVDGNRFYPYGNIPYACIVQGDAQIGTIAAASVLAKTYRDEYMQKIDEEFPYYMWKKNKGYPTAEHRKAIEQHGVSPYHRKSFQLLSKQMKISF